MKSSLKLMWKTKITFYEAKHFFFKQRYFFSDHKNSIALAFLPRQILKNKDMLQQTSAFADC